MDADMEAVLMWQAVRQALEEVLVTQAASQAATAQQQAAGQPSPRQQPAGANPSPYPATPDLAQPQNGHRNLELVFVHDCRSIWHFQIL